MDDEAIGVIAIIAIAAGALLAIGGIWIGSFYLGDKAVEATIIDKSCGLGPGSTSTVAVETKFPVPGIEHKLREFPNDQCAILTAGKDGNFVQYHVRSSHTILYENEGGPCIWDSETGVGCGQNILG